MEVEGSGRFSCFHRGEERQPPFDQDTIADVTRITAGIEGFYHEAARRLPVDEMPELLSCIHAGGNCFGLADPVTNVILNAVALLSGGEHLPSPAQEPPPPPAGGWSHVAFQSYMGLRAFMGAYFRYLSDTQARRYLCLASHDLSLAVALVRHDRFAATSTELLPDGGAIRAALAAAAREAGHPAPDVLARLMTAQYPPDLLRPVMAVLQQRQPLSAQHVSQISDLLARQWPPNRPPAYLEFRLPTRGDAPAAQGTDGDGSLLELSTCIGRDLVAHIKIERTRGELEYIPNVTFHDESMKTKVACCIQVASNLCKHGVSGPDYDASPCEFIQSLKLQLLDTIHGCYIKALAKLPRNAWSPRFRRALLLAGHGYGPLDTVSNIILSSAWYSFVFPSAHGAESQLPQGILSTRSLSRLESRSLHGMVAILRSTFDVDGEAIADSDHDALVKLNRFNCDMPTIMRSRQVGEQENNPFVAATVAAKHPQQAAFADFLGSLSDNKRDRLSYLLKAPGRISDDHWDMVNAFLHEECTPMPVAAQMEVDAAPSDDHWTMAYYREDCPFTTELRAPLGTPGLVKFRPREMPSIYSKPSPMSLFALAPQQGMFQFTSPATKALAFRKRLDFVRAELNKLLREYCCQHPWEPIYQLDIVCGVMESSRSVVDTKLYHANFLASTSAAMALSERKLFFAEFWGPSWPQAQPIFFPKNPSSQAAESKLSNCSLVSDYMASAGRCTICETQGSMIVHPPSGGHSGDIKGFVDLYPNYVNDMYKIGFQDVQEPDILYE
ncbi:hypothetical protein ACP70R_042537 [Stipagrostis hirtigluma subsp. patula]